jgi:CRP-like cAMP-binding protein
MNQLMHRELLPPSTPEPDCRACAMRPFCGADQQAGATAPVCPVERRYRLGRGDHLYHMDDPVRPAIYLVRSGCLKLYQLNQDGVQRIIDFLGPGDWLGMDAIEAPRQHSCALALSDSVVDSVPYNRVMAMLARQPRSAEQFSHRIAAEITRQQTLSAILRSASAEQRVAHFLIDRAGPAPASGEPERMIGLPMSRQDIGDFLGLTPSTVSRILSQFRNRNWITLRTRGFVLLERELLGAC